MVEEITTGWPCPNDRGTAATTWVPGGRGWRTCSTRRFPGRIRFPRDRPSPPILPRGLPTVIDDLGAQGLEPCKLLGLGPVSHQVVMDAVLHGLGFGNINEYQPRASPARHADNREGVARHLLSRKRPPGDLAPELRHRRGV